MLTWPGIEATAQREVALIDADPYKVLQVDPSASYEVIQAAYRALARRYHPDIAPGPEAAARMAMLNGAWEVLRDEDRRAEYDREHAPGAGRGAGATASGARPTAGSRTPGGSGTAQAPGSAWGSSPGAAGSSAGGTTPGGRRTSGNGAGSGATAGQTVQWRVGPNGMGAAGPPPGHPSGSVLDFGRHIGWSLGEVSRVDPGYLVWLLDRAEARKYRDEIAEILRRSSTRPEPTGKAAKKGGVFGR